METTKIYEKNISRCCPPQGRELLRDNDVIATEALFVAVPRRDASCYFTLDDIKDKDITGCCPPQGRELLPD